MVQIFVKGYKSTQLKVFKVDDDDTYGDLLKEVNKKFGYEVRRMVVGSKEMKIGDSSIKLSSLNITHKVLCQITERTFGGK